MSVVIENIKFACGVYRHAQYEFCPEIRISGDITGNLMREVSLKDLLPNAFGREKVTTIL